MPTTTRATDVQNDELPYAELQKTWFNAPEPCEFGCDAPVLRASALPLRGLHRSVPLVIETPAFRALDELRASIHAACTRNLRGAAADAADATAIVAAITAARALRPVIR